MKKRVLSLALTLCMLLSLLPSVALAAGDPTGNTAGAAITTRAEDELVTANSITVTAAAAATNPGKQDIEYAINTDGNNAPTDNWQSGLTFSNLTGGIGYYVWARTAAKTGYDAGEPMCSYKIITASVMVGGTEVINGNTVTYWRNDSATGGITGAGADASNYTVKYDPTTSPAPTLTLNGANITKNYIWEGDYATPGTPNRSAAIYASRALVIELADGTVNRLEGQYILGESAGAYINFGLTIQGTGALYAIGNNFGLYGSSITMNNGVVDAVGKIQSALYSSSALHIYDGTLTAATLSSYYNAVHAGSNSSNDLTLRPTPQYASSTSNGLTSETFTGIKNHKYVRVGPTDSTPIATPIISPAGGTYDSAQTVTLTCDTTISNIYYTTNGDEPTTGSTEYTAPFSVSATTTIKAKAFKGGMTESETAAATYTINVGPSVKVGGVTLNSATPYWKNGESSATDTAANYNAYFDADTKTLTLNGATINGKYGPDNTGAIYATEELTILLADGTVNTVTNSQDGTASNWHCGIYVEGNLTIRGSTLGTGTLTAIGGTNCYTSHGISVEGNLTIDNATATAEGKAAEGVSGIYTSGNLEIRNASTVTATAETATRSNSWGVEVNGVYTVNASTVIASGVTCAMNNAPTCMTCEVTAASTDTSGTPKIPYVPGSIDDYKYLKIEPTAPLPPTPGPTSYTITAKAGEGGTISPKGSVSVAYKGDKTFTITPVEGYQIKDVLVDGVSVGKVNTYTFEKVTKRHTIEAVFAKVWNNPFTDVSKDDPFYEAVEYVQQEGLMIGTAEDKFTPDGTFSRAMTVTVLYRLEKEPAAKVIAEFDDIVAGAYYVDALNWGIENSVALGYGNGKFGPEDVVSREQFITMLWRQTGEPEGGETPAGVSKWASQAMAWASKQGLLEAFGNELNPQAPATRAQIAQVLMLYAKLTKD